MKKIGLVLIISLIFLTGCGSEKELTYKEIMETQEYTIVDVRTKEEYLTGHVKGAINIPYDEIDENTSLDKNKNIFVYCKSGARSSKAYETLKNLGFTVYDLGAFSSIDLEKE